MKQTVILLIIVSFLVSPVLAGNVTLKTESDTYTFTTGEEARIPFFVESSFPRINVGNLAYTLTRKESQGGLSFSQSSSQSQSFPISPGHSQNAITLSSEDPVEYDVSLSLQYSDEGKDYSSDLPPIHVQFLPNQTGQDQSSGQQSTQQSNQQPGQQSGQQSTQQSGQQGTPLTSSTREMQPGNPGQSQDPFDQMEEEMNQMRQQNQQMLQQALSGQGIQSGSGNQQQPQSAQQALQNNQMNAQSSALQQQLQQEAEADKKEKEELSKSIEKDPLYKQMKETLISAGYQQKNFSVTPQDNKTGTVSATFEDLSGRQVQIQGEVKNGSLIQVKSAW